MVQQNFSPRRSKIFTEEYPLVELPILSKYSYFRHFHIFLGVEVQSFRRGVSLTGNFCSFKTSLFQVFLKNFHRGCPKTSPRSIPQWKFQLIQHILILSVLEKFSPRTSKTSPRCIPQWKFLFIQDILIIGDLEEFSLRQSKKRKSKIFTETILSGSFTEECSQNLVQGIKGLSRFTPIQCQLVCSWHSSTHYQCPPATP